MIIPPVGITPACAGNSGPASPCSPWMPDHPRVCGEQRALALAARRALGSPPRVRGTVGGGQALHLRVGITPACAGNRCAARWRVG